MANLLEIVMLLCFGASWPINLIKALKARTAKGTSLPFLCMIECGYVCGILAKLTGGNVNYVLIFYCLNIFVVGLNVLAYFRNRKLDAEREGAAV